jgi:hypothetical protein
VCYKMASVHGGHGMSHDSTRRCCTRFTAHHATHQSYQIPCCKIHQEDLLAIKKIYYHHTLPPHLVAVLHDQVQLPGGDDTTPAPTTLLLLRQSGTIASSTSTCSCCWWCARGSRPIPTAAATTAGVLGEGQGQDGLQGISVHLAGVGGWWWGGV